MRKPPLAALAALPVVLALLVHAAPAIAQCKLHRGAKIVLYSESDDPDVLVWDSRFRLRDYSAASFDVAQQLLPHARLAEPGTRAIVESCVPDFVTARLLSVPEDAVGVVIVTGSLRDQRGWVIGSDVRVLRVTRAAPRDHSTTRAKTRRRLSAERTRSISIP